MVPKRTVAIGFNVQSQCRTVVLDRVERPAARTGGDDCKIISRTARGVSVLGLESLSFNAGGEPYWGKPEVRFDEGVLRTTKW